MMRIEDVRNTKTKTGVDIPEGFFLAGDGSLWFKDSEGIVLINDRGIKGKMKRVPTDGRIHGVQCTWPGAQPVHGVIRIERNA